MRPEKILVSNIAHLGDVILSTSVVGAVKNAFPSAEIGFLTGSWSKEIVEDHVWIDHVHLFDHPERNRSQLPVKLKKQQGGRTFFQALQEIKEIGYDIAIDLYSYLPCNAAKLLYQAEILERWGYWHNCHYFFTKRFMYKPNQQHLVEEYRDFLRFCGVAVNEVKPFLSYKTPIKKTPLPPHAIALHVGAGTKDKQWPLAEWKSLVEQLDSYPLIFLGAGPEESKLIDAIAKPHHLNLCNMLSIKELIPVIQESQLLIGLDSMSGHLAAAVGTPSLTIFRKSEVCHLWRPYSPHSHIILPHSAQEVAEKVKELMA